MSSLVVAAIVFFFLQHFVPIPCTGYPAVANFLDYNDEGDYNEEHVTFMKLINVEPANNYGTRFTCNAVAPATSTDVNKLSPFDVGVVAALGDSLTAGLGAGASSFLDNFFEYKGLSWSIGGKSSLSQVTTLPNILKEFNDEVYGFSTKTHFFLFSREALNRAVTSATVKDLPGQAEDLVNQLSDRSQYTSNKWMVLTIFIGSNDLCAKSTCTNSITTTVQNFMTYLHSALHILYMNVQNVFINLMLLFDVSKLSPLKGLVCDLAHTFACDCATDIDPNMASQVAKAINSQIIEEFVLEHPYDRDDFTVVVQPMYSNIELPRDIDGNIDTSFLAPDCFHFSQKTHSIAATTLWNNMFQPVGQKSDALDWYAERNLLCPASDFPYFRTNKNSELQ